MSWLRYTVLGWCVRKICWHLQGFGAYVTIMQPCVGRTSLVLVTAWILPLNYPVECSKLHNHICSFALRAHFLLSWFVFLLAGVNLSLLSLFDQLPCWAKKTIIFDSLQLWVLLSSLFTDWSPLSIVPWMYYQNSYSFDLCNSQYYSITCATHYSTIIDSTKPVNFPNPANLTARPEKLALVTCFPSFYPGWSWLAAHEPT